jgi:hypothetical protein
VASVQLARTEAKRERRRLTCSIRKMLADWINLQGDIRTGRGGLNMRDAPLVKILGRDVGRAMRRLKPEDLAVGTD